VHRHARSRLIFEIDIGEGLSGSKKCAAAHMKARDYRFFRFERTPTALFDSFPVVILSYLSIGCKPRESMEATVLIGLFAHKSQSAKIVSTSRCNGVRCSPKNTNTKKRDEDRVLF
jgi:hypothetical protein